MILIILLLFFSAHTSAQSVGINTDGSSPDASAMLDVKSASKGFLPPRIALTGTGDVTTIASPAAGLLIFNTVTAGDVTPGYYYFDGTGWVKIGKASQASQWTSNGSTVFYNSGKVGIGTSSPGAALEVVYETAGSINNTMARFYNTAQPYGAYNYITVGKSGSFNESGLFGFSRESSGSRVWICLYGDNGSAGQGLTVSKGGKVCIGTPSPDSSALLDVSSTSKGFLPPRMTTEQRNGIAAPAAGLTIYNTSSQGIEVFNGTTWNSTVHYIGENYGGGIVFYVYDGGLHGLIASASDGDLNYLWGTETIETRATRNGIGAGLPNTTLITAKDDGAVGFLLCSNYQSGGFGDWYVPSRFELNLLYQQRNLVGGFSNNIYWSSTENSEYEAWSLNFSIGVEEPTIKAAGFGFRPIRRF